jgi:error-prone DNA polymerase
MVHPYLRRRQGKEPVTYPSEAVREVLARTLGVPLFQEQVIKLAMVAAGFSPGEADQLRRAMAAWRRRGGLEPYRIKLLEGMRERGYAPEFAERIYRQILGFGEYGFPESHAASFALLVYVSAWLKRYEPAAFCAAIINSLPMGFYAPAQLVRDAREHAVEVRPVDVTASLWDCTLEPTPSGLPALRLGFRLVSGLSGRGVERLLAARAACAFRDVDDLARRGRLDQGDLKALAAADTLVGLAGHRHQARWEVAGVETQLPLLGEAGFIEEVPRLSEPDLGQQVLSDYAQLGLTLREHPLALIRERLTQRRILSAAEVAQRPAGERVRVAGLVLIRQRPGNGRAIFVTLEDETGSLNLIIWADLAERQRRVLLGAKLLGADAQIQRADGVQHLLCRRLEDHTRLLGGLTVRSRDFQ